MLVQFYGKDLLLKGKSIAHYLERLLKSDIFMTHYNLLLIWCNFILGGVRLEERCEDVRAGGDRSKEEDALLIRHHMAQYRHSNHILISLWTV